MFEYLKPRNYILVTSANNKRYNLNFVAETYTQTSWPSRIIVFSYWFMAIMMTAVYTGNLTAALAIPVTSLPFNTLDELVQNSEYTFQVIDGTVAYQLLIVRQLIKYNFGGGGGESGFWIKGLIFHDFGTRFQYICV